MVKAQRLTKNITRLFHQCGMRVRPTVPIISPRSFQAIMATSFLTTRHTSWMESDASIGPGRVGAATWQRKWCIATDSSSVVAKETIMAMEISRRKFLGSAAAVGVSAAAAPFVVPEIISVMPTAGGYLFHDELAAQLYRETRDLMEKALNDEARKYVEMFVGV